MSKVKTGVIGVGAMGKNHARVYAELENAELTAICDTDVERAREMAAEFGGQAVTDLAEFATLVDAATVATPSVTHRAIGEQLLSAGVHCLIEKPIADTPEDAKALVELAHQHNCLLQVGHIERFNPVLGKLEERLNAPKFIEVHRLSPFPNRSMDVGVVLDVMIHDIEIVLHLVRSPIESIDAVGVPVLTQREDIANARIRFENGCVANITASRISPEKLRKIRVFQHDAYLSLDYQAQEGKMMRKDGMQIIPEEVVIEKDEPLKLELASFVDCVAQGKGPKVGGAEAAAALEVAIRITELIAADNPLK
ncbi:MAG: putative dehydrogenase [Verrucomicrobiales bacterium]|jgi:predicted dehydrogenase